MTLEAETDRMTARPRDLWLLALTALAARVALAMFYPPLVADDSWSYLNLAERIAGFDFRGYQAQRTPVFPLLLLVCGKIPEWTAAVQHFLGLGICLLLYELFRRVFRSRKAGLLAGLSYALNPSQVLMERALLSEPVTAFLVTATLLALIAGLESGRMRGLLAAGAGAGLAVLARPAFLYLPLLVILFTVALLIEYRPPALRAALRGAVATALPAVFLIGGWMAFNYAQTGYPGLSSLGGYSLINETGGWIEKAPPGYETIRDIYLKYRAEQVRATGGQSGTIYLAREELQAATGLNEYQLAGRLTGLSLRLILADPLAYSVIALRCLVRFWRPAWYTDEGGIRAVLGGGLSLSRVMLTAYIPVYLCLSAAFLILPVLFLFRRKSSLFRQLKAGGWRLTLLYLAIWGEAIFQALTSDGENNRYKMPVEPLVLGIGIYALYILYRGLRSRISDGRDNETA